ncbi:hypothetical protein SALBM135S_09103 [Streptomyces alboniger]
MLIAPTALSLTLLVLFVLAMKGSDTVPRPTAAGPAPEQPEASGTAAAGR